MTSKELQIIGLIIAIPLIGYALWVNRLWAEPDPPKPSAAFEIMVEQKKADVEYILEIEQMHEAYMSDEEIKDTYDRELLARVVEAEAGGEPLIGKKLVAAVILNRIDHPQFPDTLKEVVYQQSQFTTVQNGRIYEVVPSDETYLAIQSEIEHRTDSGIIYFNSKEYPKYGKPWGKVYGHYFATE